MLVSVGYLVPLVCLLELVCSTLLLDTGNNNTLHKLALREKEQQCRKKDGDHSSCHRRTGESSKRAEEIANTHRQREQVIFANQIHQWVEIVIPSVEKVEQCHGCKSRESLRNDHRPQRSERPCAINHSCLVQFLWNTHKILAQQKHVVGIGKKRWYDERRPVSHPSKLRTKNEQRDERSLGRQNNRGNQDDKQDVLAWNGKTSEAISDKDRTCQCPDGTQDGDGNSIAEQQQEIDLAPCRLEVFPGYGELIDRSQGLPVSLPIVSPIFRMGWIHKYAVRIVFPQHGEPLDSVARGDVI